MELISHSAPQPQAFPSLPGDRQYTDSRGIPEVCATVLDVGFEGSSSGSWGYPCLLSLGDVFEGMFGGGVVNFLNAFLVVCCVLMSTGLHHGVMDS